jgi:hypothetical protein
MQSTIESQLLIGDYEFTFDALPQLPIRLSPSPTPSY